MLVIIVIIAITTALITLRIKECQEEDIQIKKCKNIINQGHFALRSLYDF